MAQTVVPGSIERCSVVAEFLKKKTTIRPTIGVVCGSGLGSIANLLKDQTKIRYEDIPTYPTSTVPGHLGFLVFGNLAGKQVVVMQGRFHWYESLDQEKLERLGPRFVAMNDVYDTKLRSTVMEIASELGMLSCIREGVYVQVGGPTYESPAECRMLHAFGADVVGMSTVPEAMVAHHAGIKIVAFSMVSNVSIFETDGDHKTNHDEVLDTAEKCVNTLKSLIAELVKRI